MLDAVHDSGRGGILVTFRHQQRVAGIGLVDVRHDAVKVLLARDTLQLISISGQLRRASEGAFVLDAAEATAIAFGSVTGELTRPEEIDVDGVKDGAGYQRATVLVSEATVRHIRVKPVFAPMSGSGASGGSLARPAYAVELSVTTLEGDSLAYMVVVDAGTGRVLKRGNLSHAAEFKYRVWADATGDKRPLNGALGRTSRTRRPRPTAATRRSSRRASSPSTASTRSAANPWLAPTAPPRRSGNNVDAYADRATTRRLLERRRHPRQHDRARRRSTTSTTPALEPHR